MKRYRVEAEREKLTKQEAAAWNKIELSFRQAKAASPHKGFGNRWLQIRRREELADKKRREAWLALGNATAVLAILGIIVIPFWPIFSQPVILLAGLLDTLLEGLTVVFIAIGVGLSIFSALPVLVWIVVAIAFFGLVGLWASLLNRFSMQRSLVDRN